MRMMVVMQPLVIGIARGSMESRASSKSTVMESPLSMQPPLQHKTSNSLSHGQRSRAITLLALAAFSSTAAFRICDPLLPRLANEFSTQTSEVAMAVTFFAFGYGTCQLLYGPLGDSLGKFRVVTIAVCACALASIGCALSQSLSVLVMFRGIAGLSAAAIVPMSMAWIGDAVPYADRQVWLARFLTGTIVGMAAGQVIGGLAADLAGWRTAFVVLSLIYVMVGGLLVHELRRDRLDRRPRADRSTQLGYHGLLSRQLSVLALRWPRWILLTVCIEGALVFGCFAFVPLSVHSQFGLSLTLSGAVGAAYAIGGLAYTRLARRLLKRFGERGLAIAGGTVLFCAFVLFAVAPTWTVALVASTLAGLGFYMFHGILQTHATEMLPAARGTAVSLFSAALFIGQSVGVGVAGALVESIGIKVLFSVSAMALLGLAIVFASKLKAHPARSGA
jgi:predicted MFS family arabinose efflux permease